jgi:hypothetical protein
MDAMHEGGCECGGVRYRIGAPIFVNCCHCRMCQRHSGSAFAINAMIEADRVELIQGDVEVTDGVARCPSCGVKLWAIHSLFGEALRFVRVGTLDRSEELLPDAHFFTRSRHPWVTLPDDVPCFETLPEEGVSLLSNEARQRKAAALAGKPVTR